MPPHTTKRIITSLKKNIQNFQKIKLYGSPTTKELKKKYSSNQLEEWKWAAGEESTYAKAVADGTGSPTFTCR